MNGADTTTLGYEQKKQQLTEFLRENSGAVRLAKDSSNLFRDRKETPARRLDVRQFNDVHLCAIGPATAAALAPGSSGSDAA